MSIDPEALKNGARPSKPKFPGVFLSAFIVSSVYFLLAIVTVQIPVLASKFNPDCGGPLGQFFYYLPSVSFVILVVSFCLFSSNYSAKKKSILVSVMVLLALAWTIFIAATGGFYISSCGL